MRIFFQKIFYTALIFLLPLHAFSQSPVFSFKKFTTADGLTSNDCRALLQDSDGYLWVATSYGVNRYDGFSFQNFQHSVSDTNSLLSNNVHSMVQLTKNYLVLGSDIGVSVFNLRKNCFQNSLFKWHDGKKKKINVESVFADADKNLWVYHDYKIDVYDSAFHFKYCFTDLPAADSLNNFRGMPANPCQLDAVGNIWLATYGSGLVMISRKHDAVKQIDLFPERENKFFDARSIYIDKKNKTVWLSFYWDGLIAYHYDTKAVEHFFKVLPENDPPGLINTFNSIIPYKNYFLLCSEGGLLSSFNRDTKKFNSLTAPNDLLSAPVDYGFQLLMDADSNLWYAMGGLHKTSLRNKAINVIQNELWLPELNAIPALSSMAVWNSDTLLIGTDENGLLIYDLRNSTVKHINFSESKTKFYNSITCIFIDSKRRIWVGAGPKLFLLNIKTGGFTEAPAELKSTSHQELYCMYEDTRKNIWFCYRDKPFVRLNADGTISTSSEFPFSINNLKSFCEDAKGNVWFAANYIYFYQYSFSSNKIFSYPDSTLDYYPQEWLSGIVSVNDSILYLASKAGHGLIEFNTSTHSTHYFGKSDGLSNEKIYSLTQDENGNLWMLTNSGLASFNLITKHFKNFSLSSDLNLDDAPQFIYYDSPSKQIFTICRNAVIHFSPEKLTVIQNEKPIFITHLKVNDKEIFSDFSSPLQLDYNQNQLSIQFTSVNLADENSISFLTKLEGADNDFVNVGSLREVNLRNLTPGTYRFLVRTSDGETLSKNFASLSFIIASPWWQSWWFYSLCVLLIAFVLYAAYRYRVDKLMLVMDLRNRISRDLHDEVGSTLSSISMLSKVASSDSDNKEAIEMIGSSSQRMMNAMDDIVWSINPKNDEMKFLAVRLKEVAAEILESAEINYELHIQAELNEVKIPMEKRRELYLIYKEALNNIAKYSKCTHAKISLSKKAGRIEMEISDNGIGFDTSKINSGNGLTSMKERSEILKADFKITSEGGKGTTINLKI